MEKILIDEKTQDIKKQANKLYNDLRLSLLREGKAIYLTALGASMYPFVKNGDRIKIEPVGRKIRIGDIAAVDIKTEERTKFLVHRIVKITGDDENRVYFTKGDSHNSKDLDGPVAIESIIGKITQIKRNGLDIDLETPLWRCFNSLIGRLSFRYPGIIPFFSTCISVVLEHKLFLAKIKNRLKNGNPILHNTEELLLISARIKLNEELKNKAIDLTREGINWEVFCKYALAGGFTVLIYGSLMEISGYTHIPIHVIDRLRSASIFIISKSASQDRMLAKILELFTAENIPVIPLKGTILAKRLYGDIAARGLGVDFDFLIKEKDKEKAAALLKREGYTYNPEDEVPARQWQRVFTKSGSQMVDLHWDITMACRSRARIEGLWDGTRLIKKGSMSYYEFNKDELLLYLCAHLASSDAYRHLRYICDINELLNKNDRTIDFDRIARKAKLWGLSSSLYFALEACRELLNSHLSAPVLDMIKPSLVKRFFGKFFINRKVILRNCGRRRIMDRFLSYIFFELLESRTFQEYMRVIKRVIIPPKEIFSTTGKDNLSSSYCYGRYITRFFRGFVKLLRF